VEATLLSDTDRRLNVSHFLTVAPPLCEFTTVGSIAPPHPRPRDRPHCCELTQWRCHG